MNVVVKNLIIEKNSKLLSNDVLGVIFKSQNCFPYKTIIAELVNVKEKCKFDNILKLVSYAVNNNIMSYDEYYSFCIDVLKMQNNVKNHHAFLTKLVQIYPECYIFILKNMAIPVHKQFLITDYFNSSKHFKNINTVNLGQLINFKVIAKKVLKEKLCTMMKLICDFILHKTTQFTDDYNFEINYVTYDVLRQFLFDKIDDKFKNYLNKLIETALKHTYTHNIITSIYRETSDGLYCHLDESTQQLLCNIYEDNRYTIGNILYYNHGCGIASIKRRCNTRYYHSYLIDNTYLEKYKKARKNEKLIINSRCIEYALKCLYCGEFETDNSVNYLELYNWFPKIFPEETKSEIKKYIVNKNTFLNTIQYSFDNNLDDVFKYCIGTYQENKKTYGKLLLNFKGDIKIKCNNDTIYSHSELINFDLNLEGHTIDAKECKLLLEILYTDIYDLDKYEMEGVNLFELCYITKKIEFAPVYNKKKNRCCCCDSRSCRKNCKKYYKYIIDNYIYPNLSAKNILEYINKSKRYNFNELLDKCVKSDYFCAISYNDKLNNLTDKKLDVLTGNNGTIGISSIILEKYWDNKIKLPTKLNCSVKTLESYRRYLYTKELEVDKKNLFECWKYSDFITEYKQKVYDLLEVYIQKNQLDLISLLFESNTHNMNELKEQIYYSLWYNKNIKKYDMEYIIKILPKSLYTELFTNLINMY